MSDVPLASYEDPRWFPTNETPVGTRGSTGVPPTLTTTGAANSTLVLSAKDCAYANDPPIKVGFVILANGAPSALYEDGYPAIWEPPTDLGFKIIMKRGGMQGNYFTVTLINPGRVSSLKISRPAAKNVVITLAYAGSAVTTTPALLIAAINGDPELGEYMTAFASSAAAGVLPGVAQKAFTGGQDVPGLTLVSLGTDTAGALLAAPANAANTVKNLLGGSRYFSATAVGTGAVNVAALPVTALSGPTAVASATQTLGTANRGDVSEQYLARRKAWTHRRRAGDPLGKETNKTLQLRSLRFGTPRSCQRVPKQDRAVVTSRFQNYATDTLAAKSLG